MIKQKGLSFVGFIMLAIAAAFVALIGFKIVPAYTEYFSIKKAVKAVAKDNGGQSPTDIRNAFQRYAEVDYFKAAGPSDLQISQSAGKTVIVVQYDKEVELIGNVFLVFKFDIKASSGGSD